MGVEAFWILLGKVPCFRRRGRHKEEGLSFPTEHPPAWTSHAESYGGHLAIMKGSRQKVGVSSLLKDCQAVFLITWPCNDEF